MSEALEQVETPKSESDSTEPRAEAAPAKRAGLGYLWGARAARGLASKAFPLVCIGVGLLVIGIRAAEPSFEPIAFFVIFALAAATLLIVGHFFIRPLSELLHKDQPSGRIKRRTLPHQRGIDLLAAIEKLLEDQRAAVTELGLQRDRFRDLISGVNGILWEADPETWQFRFVSSRAEAILGYPISQWTMEPQFWAEHLHPEDRFQAVRRCLQPLEPGTYHQFEYRMFATDGQIVWLRDVLHVVEEKSPDGTSKRIVRGLASDITALKQIERALRRERESLTRLFGNLPGMAYRCRNDEFWTCEMLSEGALALTGYLPEDLIDNRKVAYVDLIHPDDREMVSGTIRGALENRKPFQITYRIIDLGGHQKWVWEQGCGVFDHKGRVAAIEGFITDITERVQAEEESERLAAIPISNPSPILIFDLDGSLRYCNPATLTMVEIAGVESAKSLLPRDHEDLLRRLSVGDISTIQTESEVAGHVFEWDYQAIRKFGIVHLYGTDITAARVAEDSLRRSEKRFRTAVDHYPGMLVMFDAERRITYLNKPALAATGLGEDEVLGHTNEETLPPAVATQFAPAQARAYETKEPQSLLATIDFPSGRAELISTYVPLLDDSGAVREMMVVTNDVSELKETERALKRERDRAQQYLNLSGAMFVALDLESRVTMVNRAACDTLEYSEEELIGQSWFELCVPHEFRSTRRDLHNSIMNGNAGTRHTEAIVQTKNGARRTIAWQNSRLRDENGLVCGILGAGIDISDRIQAEEGLRELNEFLDTIIDNIPDILFVKDARNLRYLRVNKAASNAVGRSAHELLGHTDDDVFPAEVASKNQAEDRSVLASGHPLIIPTEEFTTGAGEERVLHSRKIPICDSAGKPRYILGICEDITGTVTAERERARTLSILRATLDAVEDGILAVDLSDNILANNSRFLEMWGVPDHIANATDDRPLLEFVTSQVARPEEFVARVREIYADPGTVSSDMVETADGRIIERHSRSQILDGQTVGRVWSFRDRTSAIRTERELRESREFLNSVMQNASDMISVFSEDARILHVSGACERLLGYKPEELIGKPGLDHMPAEARGAALQKLTGLLSNPGSEMAFSLPFIHKNGTIRIMEGIGRDLRHLPGIRGILMSSHDVTERDYAERISRVLATILQAVNETNNLTELLKYCRDQVSTLMDVTNFYVALYDESRDVYSFPFVVDEVEGDAEFPPQAMKNSLTDYVRRVGRPMLVDEATQHRLADEHQIELVGHWSPVWMGVPLRTSGPIFGVVAMQNYRDATVYGPRELDVLTQIADRIALAIERKRVADARDRLSTAVDQVIEIVLITDARGVIQYVNPAFTRVTGYRPEEAIGQTPRLLSSGRHAPEYYQEFWETLMSGHTWKGNFVNRKKDGTLYTEEATVTPVRDHGGAITNFVAIKRDITEEMQLEAQLRQSQKLESVGSLAAGIAHEINTPIQFVGDNVRFMKESFQDIISPTDRMLELVNVIAEPKPEGTSQSDAPSPTTDASAADLNYLKEEIPKAIEQTLEGVDRIATIVRAMKDFSHPDQGEKMPSDINRALTSTLTVARNEFKYVADLVTDFDESIPSVWCFLSDLNQAFLNIIVNAAHAIADAQTEGKAGRGTITVRTKRVEKGVLISISDTGTGIPEDIRDRIFDHFFTTKEVGRGTGQGLTISRSVVVDKHGGELTFETEMGVGTTFHMLLPVGTPSTSQLMEMLEEK